MKKVRLAVLALVVWHCSCALGAQIDKIPWDASNTQRLSGESKAAVAAFINKLRDPGVIEVLNPYNIEEFEWIDLAGDGRCELVVRTHWPAISVVTIYWRNATGFGSQSLKGETSLKRDIRDLDSDGKKEIIVYSYLDLTGRRAAGSATPVWPQVYRLEGESYVPASKDFPAFYDLEILPKLAKKIVGPRHLEPSVDELAVAALEMQRDKILRVLGRDPNAGLEKARYWAKSDDPELVEDAVDVFLDIPGHEAEANAAKKAEQDAFRSWVANDRNN